MKNDCYNAPLTAEEQKFAEENYYLVAKYLRIRKLPYDEWHDVVILRYLRAVKRWFALPELHDHNFEIIAFYGMRSAIGHEREKEKRRPQTVSLDDIIPGTTGVTYQEAMSYDPWEAIYA